MSLPPLLPHLYCFLFFLKIQNNQPTTHNFHFEYNSKKKKTPAVSQCVCGEKFSMDEKIS